MIGLLFEILCFVMFTSMVFCVIPEPEKPYQPRERPPFNQKLWEPSQEVFEKRQLSNRWMKPSKSTDSGVQLVPTPSVPPV